MSRRVGGVIFLKIDGEQRRVKGNWTYNLGKPKREAVVGMDSTHGYKETPQVAFIEGAITDDASASMEELVQVEGATIVLELANGKVISLNDAWFAGDGNASTEEGEIEARFEGMSADEIR